jgi:hypothetical protein
MRNIVANTLFEKPDLAEKLTCRERKVLVIHITPSDVKSEKIPQRGESD